MFIVGATVPIMSSVAYGALEMLQALFGRASASAPQRASAGALPNGVKGHGSGGLRR